MVLSSARRAPARYSPARQAQAWPAFGAYIKGPVARIGRGAAAGGLGPPARGAVNWNADSIVRLRRLFLESFSVMDLAEPLVSVDAERGDAEARAPLDERGFDLVGARTDGLVRGYTRRDELAGGRCGDNLHRFGSERWERIVLFASRVDELLELAAPASRAPRQAGTR
jgi:hypothetical protein